MANWYHNYKIAEKRLLTVRDWLIENPIPENEIQRNLRGKCMLPENFRYQQGADYLWSVISPLGDSVGVNEMTQDFACKRAYQLIDVLTSMFVSVSTN